MAPSRLSRCFSIGTLVLLSTLVLSTGVVTPVVSSSGHSVVSASSGPVIVSDTEGAQTTTIDISITDSSNGQDSATVPITVESQQSDNVPTDLPSSVSSAQYNAWAGSDGTITQSDAIAGFNGWFNDGSYNGVSFSQQATLDLFNYWFNS